MGHKPRSENPAENQPIERVILETENSYESSKDKDHSKGARKRLHFDEIDEVREQRVEKVKKERKFRKERAAENEVNDEGNTGEDGQPVKKKPEGKLIKLDDAATRRAKMQKQMN